MIVASLDIICLILVVLIIAGVVSISHGPIPPASKAIWATTVFILPGVASLVWFWWVKVYYPKRKSENPDWEPGIKSSYKPLPRRTHAEMQTERERRL